MAQRAAPRRQRFARAAILSGLAAVVVLNAGLLAAVELVPRLRDPLYGDKARRLCQRFAATPERSLSVVMLGSSRTGVGFHARLAEEMLACAGYRPLVFNFGIPSAGPITNLLYMRRLLADGIRPDVVVIEVMPPFLAAQPLDPFERSGFASYRLRHAELDLAIGYGFPKADVTAMWWAAVVNPWYGLREPLLDRLFPKALPHDRRSNWSRETDAWGWNAIPNGPPPRAELQTRVGRGHQHYQAILANLKIGDRPAQALRDLVTLCQREGIQVCLVLMPEGSWYRSWYGPDAEAELQGFLNRLARELAVPIADARTWVADEHFNDSHHLLQTGAARFTERLTSECLIPSLCGGADARR